MLIEQATHQPKPQQQKQPEYETLFARQVDVWSGLMHFMYLADHYSASARILLSINQSPNLLPT